MDHDATEESLQKHIGNWKSSKVARERWIKWSLYVFEHRDDSFQTQQKLDRDVSKRAGLCRQQQHSIRNAQDS